MQAPLQARNDSDAASTDTVRTVAQKRLLADNRPEAVAQRKLAEMINNRPRVLQQRSLSDAIHNSPRMVAQRHEMNAFFGEAVSPQGDGAMPTEASVAQREEKLNNTGLPNQLKSGIESLSGMSMDHVKVHYNSGKPAQLQAHAYAQGHHIHLASGQEKHLPHEAWHVVQQAQGRVKPTIQLKGTVGVNDDVSLEREADLMGAKALATSAERSHLANAQDVTTSASPVQRYIRRFKPVPGAAGPGALEAMSDEIDKLTTQAHTITLTALKTGDPSDVAKLLGNSGYYSNWLRSQNAMTSGYIIEDIITRALSGKPGYEAQVVHGGARPDFVISDGKDKGVVDITSSKEAGHVLDKNFSLGTYAYVAESLYSSIDFRNIQGSTFTLTQSDLSLIAASNKTRAVAKFGEGMAQLKKTLTLIVDQGIYQREASTSAAKAIKAINAVLKEPTNDDLVQHADSFIKDVLNNYSAHLHLDNVSIVMESIMKKYDVDKAVFAGAKTG